MSANKSSNHTTKVKKLPESLNWLIDFANIGSKPGKLFMGRVGQSPALKRPPSEPVTSKEICLDSNLIEFALSNWDEARYIKEGLFRDVDEARFMRELYKGFISGNKKYNKGRRVIQYRDEKGNEWLKGPNKEIDFAQNKNVEPSLKALRNFLSKTGIHESVGSSEYWTVKKIWHIAKSCLLGTRESDRDLFFEKVVAQAFVSMCYDRKQIQFPESHSEDQDWLIKGLKYSHDNTLVQVICAYTLDFWHNHKEWHKSLRQCSCCGKFWVGTKTKKYCCKKCLDRFNQASRQAVSESVRKQRKTQNNEIEGIVHNEIITWLCRVSDRNTEQAEKIFYDEKRRSSTNIKSLANFKRTYGKRSGLT